VMVLVIWLLFVVCLSVFLVSVCRSRFLFVVCCGWLSFVLCWEIVGVLRCRFCLRCIWFVVLVIVTVARVVSE